MAYKDKDKQKEAQRERTRRYRNKQKGVTSQGVTQGVTSGVIIDATGNIHRIDFEGRRKDHELLESWANGKGTEQQRRYGVLAMHYAYSAA